MLTQFFEITADIENCQYFLFKNPEDGLHFQFDGSKWANRWSDPKMFSFEPMLPECDFWGFGQQSAFAFAEDLLERTPELYSVLSPAGELLPFTVNQRKFNVLNITACYDALDRERTIWQTYPAHRATPAVEEPRFDIRHLGWELFKIPETSLISIYFREDGGSEETQFRSIYEAAGLTGLQFTSLYSTPDSTPAS